MIILDTNIISEMVRPNPNPDVFSWLDTQNPASLFITSITEAELAFGIAVLPSGKRKNAIQTAIHAILYDGFNGRILPFDSDSARISAIIRQIRKKLGTPISDFDALIASIVRSTGAKLATRNIDDFRDCEIELINPWDIKN